jgi:hypothetical protein
MTALESVQSFLIESEITPTIQPTIIALSQVINKHLRHCMFCNLNCTLRERNMIIAFLFIGIEMGIKANVNAGVNCTIGAS